MVRQRVRRNVVGLDERGIQQITQCDAVSGLKADVVFLGPGKRLLRDHNCLVEIAGFPFRPIEHHTRSRNFS